MIINTLTHSGKESKTVANLKPDLEALQLALKMEQDGRKFFLEASEKASHPLAQGTFNALADWELEHIRIIERFYASLKDKGEWESVESLQPQEGSVVATFKTIFQDAREHVDETAKAATGDLEAHRMARDFEEKISIFYRERAAQTTTEDARVFYEFMARQEAEHYEILENGLEYMEDPAKWTERGEWTF